MEDARRFEFTQILRDLAIDRGAGRVQLDRAFEIVYGELRKLAGSLMDLERSDHTLEPTALVHEAYARLVDQHSVEWQDRAHFFGIASRAMRQILVDHARKRSAVKRGGDRRRIPLDDHVGGECPPDTRILDLDEAMQRLARLDERAVRVVEMRVFGGLTAEETALVLGVSRRTVQNDWKFAKMWLGRDLAGGDS
jgi:RNA polymerase sigma-70 factor (ECF subfamily)